jgi:hypothetical protein
MVSVANNFASLGRERSRVEEMQFVYILPKTLIESTHPVKILIDTSKLYNMQEEPDFASPRLTNYSHTYTCAQKDKPTLTKVRQRLCNQLYLISMEIHRIHLQHHQLDSAVEVSSSI